jgi:hypothetical protein
MSGLGPPYPHPNPVPGSNSIGQFIIGVSPIGDIAPFDYWVTVLSQYANSPILTTIISNFYQYIDQTQNLDSFFDLIWNVLTAQGYGLDVWGRIVGISRTFQSPSTVRNFGFDEATTVNADPWNVSPFYSGPNLQNTFSLSDTAFRPLVLAKAAFNITDGAIPSINQLLLSIFPNRGNCFVTDGGNMTMTYTFSFVLSLQELGMLIQSGVLPKPTGVSATIVHL